MFIGAQARISILKLRRSVISGKTGKIALLRSWRADFMPDTYRCLATLRPAKTHATSNFW
jgi:hypothetical protein